MTSSPSPDGQVPATPAVRQLAAQHGVDLVQVRGTGVGGRITTGDVTATAAFPGELAAAVARGAVTSARAEVFRTMAADNAQAAMGMLHDLPGAGAGNADVDGLVDAFAAALGIGSAAVDAAGDDDFTEFARALGLGGI